MRERITAALGAVALIVPAIGAATTPPKKKVVTLWRQARGPVVTVDRWGDIQVLLVIRKRIATIGTKKYVGRKITAVRLPVWPSSSTHTIGINRQALPMLVQQVLTEQFAVEIDYIGEATDTSVGFEQSLQVALANGRRV